MVDSQAKPIYHKDIQAVLMQVFGIELKDQKQSDAIKYRVPVEAMAELDRMIYRRAVGRKIQPPQALFRAIGKLAQAAPVHVLPRREGIPLDSLDKMAERLESHARGLLQV